MRPAPRRGWPGISCRRRFPSGGRPWASRLHPELRCRLLGAARFSSRFFRSILSCGRPVDRLQTIRSSRDIMCADSPPKSTSTRFFQAVPNETPETSIRMSTPDGGDANLENQLLPREVLRLDFSERRAEPAQRFVDSERIGFGGVHPKIKIFGVPRFRVLHHGVAADHEIPDAAFVSSAQQFAEVGADLHLRLSPPSPQPPAPRQLQRSGPRPAPARTRCRSPGQPGPDGPTWP